MKLQCTICFVVVLCCFGSSTGSDDALFTESDYRIVSSVVQDCRSKPSMNDCLAEKAAVAIERTINWDIPLFDGLILARNEEIPKNTTRFRSLTTGVTRLSNAINDFLNSHTLSLDLTTPDASTGRGTGRDGGLGGSGGKKGKKEKKYLRYAVMALLGVFGLTTPLVMKTLAVIAGKALIASKIALVIVGSVALKKIFEANSGHSTVKVHTHTVQEDEGHVDDYDRYMPAGAYKFLKTL